MQKKWTPRTIFKVARECAFPYAKKIRNLYFAYHYGQRHRGGGGGGGALDVPPPVRNSGRDVHPEIAVFKENFSKFLIKFLDFPIFPK